MKVSFISQLLCAMALTLSLPSFAGHTNEDNEEKKEVTTGAAFDAAVYKINNSNKVRLLVDKNADERLRVILKDRGGRVYYSEAFGKQSQQHYKVISLVFNLDEVTDGTYYLELYNGKNKIIKAINVESRNARAISLR